MKHVALVLVLLAAVCRDSTAARWPLSVSQQQQQQQQQPVQAQQGFGPPAPWQPFQQLQQQIQQQINPGGSTASSSSSPNSSTGHKADPNAATPATPTMQGLAAPAPWQPFQQLQQQIQQEINPNNSSSNSSSNSTGQKTDPYAPTPITPSMQFVTVDKQERPTELKKAEQQKEPQINPSKFECGKPYMPCGSAIPDGKKCEKGAGWCESGFYCGYDATTTEPSRCLPVPKDCGKAGQPCCPSNSDSPHSGSTEDKLQRKPFCKDPNSYCFYYALMDGLNNGDLYAGNKGAYACTAVAPDCGTGPGKPCCPFAYKIATNPPLNRTGCADKLYCNYDFTPAVAATNLQLELLPASVPGTCEANAADCGKFGKGCCIATGPSATSISCGARWEETGQRGYCADPFDSNNSAGPQPAAGGVSGRRRVLLEGGSSGNSSSAGAGSSSSSSSKRKASYKELVCTPCPPRSDNVANNPSKYWPC